MFAWLEKSVEVLKLPGSLECLFNQEECLFFPFAKIKCKLYLYYLHIPMGSQRERLQIPFWENISIRLPKKKFSNTIYQANKLLEENGLLAPNRTVLSLNPECAIESDGWKFSRTIQQSICRLYQVISFWQAISRTVKPLTIGAQDADAMSSSFISRLLPVEKDPSNLRIRAGIRVWSVSMSLMRRTIICSWSSLSGEWSTW